MRVAYIAHKISGDIPGNLEKIRQIVRHINLTEPHVVPFAPYWLDCHALDDDNAWERERGIRNDHEFFERKVMDELWVCSEISRGVAAEIKLAEEKGIPVHYKTFEL